MAWDESGWYVGSDGSEGIPAYRKQSPDGRKRAWQKNWMEAWQGPIAMASADGSLFVMQQNGKVVALNREKGAHKHTPMTLGSCVHLRGMSLRPETTGMATGVVTTSPMDMDARDGLLAVCRRSSTSCGSIPPKHPKCQRRRPWPCCRRRRRNDCCAQRRCPRLKVWPSAREGTMLVISEGKVLSIGKQREVFIAADQLENPYRVAFDSSGGDVLVAEAAPSHQIKRFDRTGKLVATYGRKGGRLDGPFVATDFLNLRDVSATTEGGFRCARATQPCGARRSSTARESCSANGSAARPFSIKPARPQ